MHVYQACVTSVVDYASTVWHDLLRDNIHVHHLNIVQRAPLIRILSSFRTVTTRTLDSMYSRGGVGDGLFDTATRRVGKIVDTAPAPVVLGTSPSGETTTGPVDSCIRRHNRSSESFSDKKRFLNAVISSSTVSRLGRLVLPARA